MSEVNGRLRVSWAQIVWGIATLSAIIGSWADTRTQIALMRQEIGLRVQQADVEHGRMWRAIDEAKADRAPERQGR